MALPDLAVSTDLSTRGIDVSNETLVADLLAVASATIRRAAGAPILEAESTVTLWGMDSDRYLNLPGQPVTAVETVVLDGDTLATDDWRLIHGRLWRSCGWGSALDPLEVTITLTHGLAEVPADIVDLCCSLVGAGLAATADGYESHGGKVAEMIGDYQVSWARGTDAVATAMSLPTGTRLMLRRAFGGGAGVVTYS